MGLYLRDPADVLPLSSRFGVLSQQARGKPMISHINDAIERTHRLTGMPREEIVRRGLIRKEIPMYGLGGATAMGALAQQDRYQPQ
jgi:hypothetical protein